MSNLIEKKSGLTPVTNETIREYLCPLATDQELAYVMNICKNTGMNPFVRDVDIIKYSEDKPAQIVTRKDWFFKTANSQPTYQGMDHGVIVKRSGEIVYQNGAFTAPGDALLGAWAEIFVTGRWPHRSEVTLSEYDKGQSNWKTMKATMINKVAKVQALRECFPEKFQGIIDESELVSIEMASAGKSSPSKPEIEMPTRIVKETPVEKPVIKPATAKPVPSDQVNEFVCSECNEPIEKHVYNFSKRVHSKALCYDHQKAQSND